MTEIDTLQVALLGAFCEESLVRCAVPKHGRAGVIDREATLTQRIANVSTQADGAPLRVPDGHGAVLSAFPSRYQQHVRWLYSSFPTTTTNGHKLAVSTDHGIIARFGGHPDGSQQCGGRERHKIADQD